MTSPESRRPRDLVRADVRALSAYHLDQVEHRFKLDQNEVPWDLPADVKDAVARRLVERDWARYPDFHGDGMRRGLAELNGHPFEGVLVGNGSNELLGVALEALAGPGDTVLSFEPTFGLYRMLALRPGARLISLSPRPDLEIPHRELLEEIRRHPRRPVILCSPNNPTGHALTPPEVEELLEALEGPLLLDNAYGEFCRHDYRPLLAEHGHLLIFRTFSKAWSLGGMRLGYVLAHPELTAELIKVKLPYNLGHAGLVAGTVVLENQDIMRRRVADLVELRGRWAAALSRRGLEVYPSEGNFLLVEVPKAVGFDVAALRAGLKERGILVRDVSHYPGLSGCMRVSVGSAEALVAMEEALEAMGLRAGGSGSVSENGTMKRDRREKGARA